MINAVVEILLIEDNPNDAELIMRTLSKSKLANHIIHLKDGAIALDFLFGNGEYQHRDTDQRPRVILLDLKMPKIDGLEVLASLKSNDITRLIPIVVLTSSKESPDIQKAYKLGASSYIVKPVEFSNFVAAISELGMYWMLLNQTSLNSGHETAV